MGVYRELDPEIAWKAIEGYRDELSPETRALDAFYRQFTCPRCHSEGLDRVAIPHATFDPTGEILVPRATLKCRACAYHFDPHSGLAISVGHGLPPNDPPMGR